MDDTQENLATQIQEGNTAQLLPYHTHNGVDSPVIDQVANGMITGLTGDVTTTGAGQAPATLATVNSNVGTFGSTTQSPQITVDGKGRITAITNVNIAPSTLTITTVAGETLAAGDVVFIYGVSTVNYAVDAYNMGNGGTYAVIASADDTTYGPQVVGIVTVGAAVGGNATVAIAGVVSGLTGLTPGAYHYLDNHSGASSNTVSQLLQNVEQDFTAGVTVQQLFNPTQDRLDQFTFLARKNGGASNSLTLTIKRHTTTLATGSASLGSNSGSLNPITVTLASPIRVYKGEIITLLLTDGNADGTAHIGYENTGSPYNGGASGGSIPANSDIYFKAYEFTNFGKINTVAGTRKFNLGTALSTTSLALRIQPDNTLI